MRISTGTEWANQNTTTPLRHVHNWIKYFRVPVLSKSYTTEIYISYAARAQYFKRATGELQSHINSPKFTWPERSLHTLLSNRQFPQESWAFPLSFLGKSLLVQVITEEHRLKWKPALMSGGFCMLNSKLDRSTQNNGRGRLIHLWRKSSHVA